eukprot:comp20602_c0_seq1/m.41931 comp20602_c0_seq1/g.41931  ORF comp20602_c0_seq1/g.41931 comp20602_c0_seq1/m.41931 type:complete len:313 (-) comp20602_c0_seq1:747-1685(-)
MMTTNIFPCIVARAHHGRPKDRWEILSGGSWEKHGIARVLVMSKWLGKRLDIAHGALGICCLRLGDLDRHRGTEEPADLQPQHHGGLGADLLRRDHSANEIVALSAARGLGGVDRGFVVHILAPEHILAAPDPENQLAMRTHQTRGMHAIAPCNSNVLSSHLPEIHRKIGLDLKDPRPAHHKVARVHGYRTRAENKEAMLANLLRLLHGLVLEPRVDLVVLWQKSRREAVHSVSICLPDHRGNLDKLPWRPDAALERLWHRSCGGSESTVSTRATASIGKTVLLGATESLQLRRDQRSKLVGWLAMLFPAAV